MSDIRAIADKSTPRVDPAGWILDACRPAHARYWVQDSRYRIQDLNDTIPEMLKGKC